MDKIEWIRDIIYLLPIAGLIWSGATMANKIRQNEKDIEELKKENKENQNILVDKVNMLMESVQGIRIDLACLKAKVNDDEK